MGTTSLGLRNFPIADYLIFWREEGVIKYEVYKNKYWSSLENNIRTKIRDFPQDTIEKIMQSAVDRIRECPEAQVFYLSNVKFYKLISKQRKCQTHNHIVYSISSFTIIN